MKSLVLLLLLGGGGYWAWKNDWPSKPLRESGAALERTLNHELSGAGISDAQIAVQLRRERTRWGVVHWVETDREITVESLSRAEALVDGFSRTAAAEGFSSEKDMVHGGILLDLNRFGLRFQRLLFFPRLIAKPPVKLSKR